MNNTAVSPGSMQKFNAGWVIKHGIIGGIVVAIVFAVAEMIITALMGGSLWMPIQAYASVPLGTPPPKIPLSTAIPLGLTFHLIYTVGLAIVFIFIWARVPVLRSSPARTVGAAAVYGIIAWVVGILTLAPALGRPWFAEQPQTLPFIYHMVFFGVALGLYLVRAAREG